MVDNSISLCKSPLGWFFRQLVVQTDLHSRSETPTVLCCWHIQQPPRDIILHPHLALIPLKRTPLARGKRAPRKPSIAGWFFVLPWLVFVADSVAEEACHLALVAARALLVAMHGGATSVIVRTPPFQIGQQLWGLLCRRPGAACERCHAMSNRQIHPLDERRVQPPREAHCL